MSVNLICPHCAAAIEFHLPPAAVCPRCGAALPEALQASAEASLARELAPRPLLLTIGIVGAAAVAVLCVAMLICAPFNVGTYEINEKAVSGAEFFRRTGALLVVVAAICTAVSYGLVTRKSWTRPLMLAYWPITFVLSIASFRSTGSNLACSAMLAAIAMGLAATYLYGKPEVQAYYRALAAEP